MQSIDTAEKMLTYFLSRGLSVFANYEDFSVELTFIHVFYNTRKITAFFTTNS